MTNGIRIGELARLCQTRVETLRYYEKEGLLPPPFRNASGYRLYSPDAVKRVQFIIRAKSLGFSLRDIAELLALRGHREESTCGEVKDIALDKLADIEEKIEQLSAIKRALKQVADSCCGGSEPATHCTILSVLDQDENGSDPVATAD